MTCFSHLESLLEMQIPGLHLINQIQISKSEVQESHCSTHKQPYLPDGCSSALRGQTCKTPPWRLT